MKITDAIAIIESTAGFCDETTPVGEAWKIIIKEIEQMQAFIGPCIDYLQHSESALLIGVPPLTEKAYTVRRLKLRNAAHWAMYTYLQQREEEEEHP